jgi:hypothetical protein
MTKGLFAVGGQGRGTTLPQLVLWGRGSEASNDYAIATHSHLYHPAGSNPEMPVGQIIQLPLSSAAYPDTPAALDPAEHALLTAIRWWVDAYRRDEDPMPRLCQGLEMAGMCDAAISLDAWMAIIARTVQQPIAIHCPRCPDLSDDERHLLHAASLAQVGDSLLAQKALRTALLSGQGAEFALGPLQGLGELFSEAGWFFRQRRPPVADRPPTAAVEPWVPSTFLATVH